MIEDSIEQLRAKLNQAEGLPEATRAELLVLLNAVERQAAVAEPVSAEPGATGEEGDDDVALGKLRNSVEELEASHPELVASINQVAAVLGKMGI